MSKALAIWTISLLLAASAPLAAMANDAHHPEKQAKAGKTKAKAKAIAKKPPVRKEQK